jgi:hypothetical protein
MATQRPRRSSEVQISSHVMRWRGALSGGSVRLRFGMGGPSAAAERECLLVRECPGSCLGQLAAAALWMGENRGACFTCLRGSFLLRLSPLPEVRVASSASVHHTLWQSSLFWLQCRCRVRAEPNEALAQRLSARSDRQRIPRVAVDPRA